ncbi:hypothetical protein [Shewanella frigidimarina]|uniref:hypothetical protein n=1 Tax=Shewanella frigidimarina TaxID=56812 RepID=UPI003D7A66B3
MAKILFLKIGGVSPRPLGLIEVDMDIAAERIIIFDRMSGQLITNTLRPTSGISKTLVEKKYTTSNNLIAGILDDGEVYACKFIDGIMAEIVDANTINMSQ